MKFVIAAAIFGLLAVTVSADVLSRVAELSYRAGARAGPVVKAAHNVRRAKRQTIIIVNETDIDIPASSQCILQCLYEMDDKMERLFPTNSTTDEPKRSRGEEVLEEYDPVKFDQFCDAYRPASKCLNQCPDSDLKNFTFNGFAMMETLCVTKNTEFKKNLPCMNKIGKEVEKVCGPQCDKYEHAIDKLDKLEETTDTSQDVDIDELKFLFSQGCKYVKCSEDCGHPMTVKACGEEAGNLETLLIMNAFKSVNDLMNTFQGLDDPEFAFWPPECRALGGNSTQLSF